MTLAELAVKINVDQTELKSAFASVKSQAKETESAVGKSFKEIATSFGLLMGVSEITQKFIDLNKEMIKATAAANVAGRRFASTFPNQLDASTESIERLVKGFNYTEEEAKSLMATVGTMGQAMGITQQASVKYAESMVGLGADLAAYFGESEKAAEMTGALEAATKGMSRQAKSLGLYLDDAHLEEYAQSLGKTAKEMDSAERAQAVLNVAMKQMTSMGAVGAAAKSVNDYSGSMRQLKNSIEECYERQGNQLLPATVELAHALNVAAQEGGVFDSALKSVSNAGVETITMLTDLVRIFTNVFNATKDSSVVTQALNAYWNAGIAPMRAVWEYNKLIVSSLADITTNGKVAGDTLSGVFDKLRNQLSNAIAKKPIKVDIKPTIAKGDDTEKKIEELWVKTQEIANKRINWNYILPNQGDDASLISLSKQMDNAIAQINTLHNIKAIIAPEIFKAASDNFDAIKLKMDAFQNSWNVLNTVASSVGSSITSMLGAISSLIQAQTQAGIDALDREMIAAEEAAGVADDTAVEKAQKEYDAAVASGDAVAIAEKKKALTKAKIEEEYEKKKQVLAFKGAHAAWELQVGQALIATMLAPLQAYVQALPIFGAIGAGIMAGIAASTALIMDAAVISAEPQPPKFATGGIIPGSISGMNIIAGENNKSEIVANQGHIEEVWNMMNGQGSNGKPIQIQVMLGDEVIYDRITKGSNDGMFVVNPRVVHA